MSVSQVPMHPDNTVQQAPERANEPLSLQIAQIKKFAPHIAAGLPWIVYGLRVNKESAGGWGAFFIITLKTIIPAGILGILSTAPQFISDKLIKACEPRSPTLLSDIVFRVIKSVTACGLFVVGTSFAINAYQKATSAFDKQLIWGVYSMFAKKLTTPEPGEDLSVYSLFPKAEAITLEQKTPHPVASLATFISGLWTLTSWKGSPILAAAGGTALITLVNISCNSFVQEPAELV